uniref:Zinc finger protein 638-like n=1 Tax=Poecilia latipinna TaxID=48699 RepID=A0A3B3W1W9_9TELE
MSLPGSYRPERNKITVDEDIDRCLDLNISRAREEVIQTSSSQNTQFTNVQRDIFPSSNKGMPSYLTSPATLVNRSFTVDNSNDSLDWLPICQRGSEEESTKKYSSASSTFQGSGESLFSTSSEGKHMSSIPGLGGYDIKRPAKFVPPPEPIRPKYTSESASNILLQFGLEKEDLEHLISYPEDQITPENLPFILREIKLEKEKKTATAVQSNPYSATQPIRSMGEKDKFIPSMGERGPVKVIDYGHSSKSEKTSFQNSKRILWPRSDSYDRQTLSRYRSRSRSYDRLSSPKRREAKRSSPRRSYERRSSPRRSYEKRSSPRRSHERRSSGERSVSGHRRSRSADRLAKRILGKKGLNIKEF